jgi:SecD/SecF fusion protein
MPQFFKNAHYKFVVHRWRTLTISGIIILAGIIMMIARGINWSVDFRGGMDLTVRFSQTVSDGAVRAALSDLQVGEVKTAGGLGAHSDILIRMKVDEGGPNPQEQVGQKLRAGVPRK